MTCTANEEPEQECQHTDAHDCWYKDKGYPVYNALHGGFRALRLLYHLDDMGEHRLLAHLLCLETEDARLHFSLVCSTGWWEDNRPCQHLVACFLLHSQRFAGNHAFIDISQPFAHDGTINGYALSRPHFDRITWLEYGDRGFGDGAVVHEVSRLGLQSYQRTDG